MTKSNAVFSLLSVCIVGYGCAAPAAGDEQVGYAAEAVKAPGGKLLALGDSIAFGYNPYADFTKDKNFVGYPELLGADVSSVKNASCPGETSGSFISATAPDNGCRTYRAAYPLHVDYDGSQTQLDYALGRIAGDNGPDDVPTLVTLNVSGNDIFLLQKSCATASDPAACFSSGAPALIGSIAHNVGTILGSIRAAGYTGRLVYQTLYSATNDQSALGFVSILNSNVANVARQFGAQIADGFGAFYAASGANHDPCAAGLLIPNPQGGCDVHPSAAGANLLANSVRNAQ
jgi:lysophospholipase L1-like esterase